MEEIQGDTPPVIRPETQARPQPATPSGIRPELPPEVRTRARKRLNDAAARVSPEARSESGEQVREIMGWA